MVIYATELVLWLGVFACGGYFNFAPWLKLKIKRRQEQSENAISTEQPNEDLGISNDNELQRVGSSTSVFRTPSSVAGSVHSSRRSVHTLR